MKVGEEYAAGSVPGFRTRYRVLRECGDLTVEVEPLDVYGSVAGSPLIVSRVALVVPWPVEAEVREDQRVKQADLEAAIDKERAQRRNEIKQVLPAFNGINSGEYRLGDLITGAADKNARQIYVSLDALVALGQRIKALSIERQGATWVAADV